MSHPQGRADDRVSQPEKLPGARRISTRSRYQLFADALITGRATRTRASKGSSATALSVVPETLMAALRLEGLSGVYVWGALLGGFPLALVLLARLSALPAPWRGLARLAPFRHRPARALGTVLGLAAGALALALSLALGIARPGGP